MTASITTVLAVLAGILIVIVVRGASALNLSMLIQTPQGGYYLGKEGGSQMPLLDPSALRLALRYYLSC